MEFTTWKGGSTFWVLLKCACERWQPPLTFKMANATATSRCRVGLCGDDGACGGPLRARPTELIIRRPHLYVGYRQAAAYITHIRQRHCQQLPLLLLPNAAGGMLLVLRRDSHPDFTHTYCRHATTTCTQSPRTARSHTSCARTSATTSVCRYTLRQPSDGRCSVVASALLDHSSIPPSSQPTAISPVLRPFHRTIQ